MTLTTTVELVIKPEALDTYVARLTGALETTRAAKGCIGISVYRDQEVENRLLAIEHWEDRAAYDAYIEWRRATGSFEKLAEVLERPIKVHFLDSLA